MARSRHGLEPNLEEIRVELPTAFSKSRIRSEAGFTLVELLTVALLVVIILGAIFPKVHSAYSAETVREARYVALAYVTTARAVVTYARATYRASRTVSA